MGFKLTLAEIIRTRLNIVEVLRFQNRLIRQLSRSSHKLQLKVEWAFNTPEYFEHQIDLNYLWHETQSAYPMERGVFSSYAMKNDFPPTGNTLDLCCGDGFYSYYFYSKRSASVTAIDFDEKAIKFARKNYGRDKNIKFIEGDVRTQIPDGPYDNIVWDAAIAHFTRDEILHLISRIKEVLRPSGILSGYTILEETLNGKSIPQLEFEFRKKKDLEAFLAPYFKNVKVFSTIYSERENLYFYASDVDLPFDR
jgi:SAM-dependent methyltransferase